MTIDASKWSESSIVISPRIVPFFRIAIVNAASVRSFDAGWGRSSRVSPFADWPTIPVLYIRGEFIGGCDIATEMYQAGELQAKLGDLVKAA